MGFPSNQPLMSQNYFVSAMSQWYVCQGVEWKVELLARVIQRPATKLRNKVRWRRLHKEELRHLM